MPRGLIDKHILYVDKDAVDFFILYTNKGNYYWVISRCIILLIYGGIY